MESNCYKDDFDFNYALSISDLILVDGWNLMDKECVERILYENGMDIELGWTTETVLHRNLQNKVVDTLRFCGKHRKDKAWLPYLSTEDLIATTSDVFMKAELMGMNRRSNFSGDLIDKYGEAGDEI